MPPAGRSRGPSSIATSAAAPDRLGGGIVLPFAIALAEYDVDPQRLALDVASGAVDLGIEAALLGEPDRRAIAEEEARRLVAAAIERIDANRTARTELIAVLGEPPRPWIGAAIAEPDLAGALDRGPCRRRRRRRLPPGRGPDRP